MTVLVTGATGTVGSHVVRALHARGVNARAFVRDRDRGEALLGPDVELAVGDFGDRASIAAALRSVDQMFLACANVPNQVELETNAIQAATVAGTQRIVKLSAACAEPGSRLDFWDMQGRIDEHLRSAGVPYVLLKPVSYMSNLLASAEMIRRTGRLFVPAGDAKLAMIDPRDVAAVAAAVLSQDEHDGRAYELTGPEALTYHDIAEVLSETMQRRIEYVDVPDEAAFAGLVEGGLPEWVARNLVTLFQLIREGAAAEVTDVVRVLTHREPRTLRDFLRDHAAAFTG